MLRSAPRPLMGTVRRTGVAVEALVGAGVVGVRLGAGAASAPPPAKPSVAKSNGRPGAGAGTRRRSGPAESLLAGARAGSAGERSPWAGAVEPAGIGCGRRAGAA